jgi:hypothetical protein
MTALGPRGEINPLMIRRAHTVHLEIIAAVRVRK